MSACPQCDGNEYIRHGHMTVPCPSCVGEEAKTSSTVWTRDDFLQKAGSLINGDRAEEYGPAYRNFDDIRREWAPIIDRIKSDSEELDTIDVAILQCKLKMARLLRNKWHRDSWVDLIGYAAIGAELAEFKQRQRTKAG